MFKDSFKYYKSKDAPPDLRSVIDFQDPDFSKVTLVPPCILEGGSTLGLKNTQGWKIYEIIDKPGLIFIENPFTSEGQRYWITKCLTEYSRKPNKLNLDAHDLLNDNEDWWPICSSDSKRAGLLLPKLRWATMGYHHNWDTKQYSENSKNKIPEEVATLTEFFARVTGFHDFRAEAVIVNYYRMNSTLSGHTDHSEINFEAPLFSISFGQTGIFLIGGLTQEEPGTAMFLRSGDIVVMSKGSRLRYHGVPKIIPADLTPWELDDLHEKTEANWDKVNAYIKESRININVRQVLKLSQTVLDGTSV